MLWSDSEPTWWTECKKGRLYEPSWSRVISNVQCYYPHNACKPIRRLYSRRIDGIGLSCLAAHSCNKTTVLYFSTVWLLAKRLPSKGRKTIGFVGLKNTLRSVTNQPADIRVVYQRIWLCSVAYLRELAPGPLHPWKWKSLILNILILNVKNVLIFEHIWKKTSDMNTRFPPLFTFLKTLSFFGISVAEGTCPTPPNPVAMSGIRDICAGLS